MELLGSSHGTRWSGWPEGYSDRQNWVQVASCHWEDPGFWFAGERHQVGLRLPDRYWLKRSRRGAEPACANCAAGRLGDRLVGRRTEPCCFCRTSGHASRDEAATSVGASESLHPLGDALLARQKVTGQTCPPWLQDQHAIWYRSHGRVSGTSPCAPARASSRSEAGRPDPPFQLHLELEGRPQARLPDAEKKQGTAAASCGSLDCASLCNRGFAKVREDGLA